MKLLILGCARSVWEDYAKVRPWDGEIMVVNDIGCVLQEPIQHWCSLHSNYAEHWRFFRQKRVQFKNDYTFHATMRLPGVDRVWKVLGAPSGVFACYVALELGYTDITVGGMPMNAEGRFIDPPWMDHPHWEVKTWPLNLRNRIKNLSNPS